jgi:hypothetical protein
MYLKLGGFISAQEHTDLNIWTDRILRAAGNRACPLFPQTEQILGADSRFQSANILNDASNGKIGEV